MAGLVIEQVSAQSYRDFMQERIFSPLGMEQTQAQLAPVPNLATGYEGKGKNLQKMDLDREQSVYAAGNIISTASDMVKWLQALNQGQLLSQSSYEQLWTSSILNNGRTTGYGLGWFVDSFNGHPYTEHSGNVRGYSSGLYRYPNERLDVVILTNNSNINVSGALIANFIAGVYQPSVSLVGLNSQPDPHPLFTQSFLSFLQGDKQNIALAPEFQLQLQTKRGKFLKKYMKAFRHIDKLEFLHEEINNGDRSYYYQTTLEGNLIYVFVKITEKQQVASYAAVNSPQF